jgi:hypothetical protein
MHRKYCRTPYTSRSLIRSLKIVKGGCITHRSTITHLQIRAPLIWHDGYDLILDPICCDDLSYMPTASAGFHNEKLIQDTPRRGGNYDSLNCNVSMFLRPSLWRGWIRRVAGLRTFPKPIVPGIVVEIYCFEHGGKCAYMSSSEPFILS